jgi:hypothetical protein
MGTLYSRLLISPIYVLFHYIQPKNLGLAQRKGHYKRIYFLNFPSKKTFLLTLLDPADYIYQYTGYYI